jgi:hypothetical protein
VRFYHTALVAEIECAMGGTVAKSSGQGRIVEEMRKRGGQVRGVARAEREAGVAKHFDECAEV